MKKILLIVAIIFATTITASAQFSGGSGTQADPYQITSKADMEALSDSCFYGNYYSIDKYFLLMNDIIDSIRTMVGTYDGSPLNKGFYGNFNGNNHKINLAISFNVLNQGGAIFGCNRGEIENIITDGAVINTALNSTVSAISTVNKGLISNCVNLSQIEGSIVAGISARNDGTIINCANNGLIYGDIAGGIAANVGGGGVAIVSNCTNTGTIIGNLYTGGVAANLLNNNSSTIQNCVNSGFVKGIARVGGIVGIAGGTKTHTIIKCINAGVIESDTYGGSILGYIGTGTITQTITDCFYDIQMCKYKAVNNQDHPGVTGLPTHLLMEELAK
ncbi:MAG: hypothetical protein LBO69_09565 [Ignavibacteria bacterium]|jgi:hypothetical protein|nr:hypothetical protein [Ignavibacteria bacterium]